MGAGALTCAYHRRTGTYHLPPLSPRAHIKSKRILSTASNSPHVLPTTIEAAVMRRGERTWPDYLSVTIVACLLSALAFLHYWHSGELLLYGDAVAHMNIARRVIDSPIPGPKQLGTVWLPLPHLLMIPLIWSTWMWRSGVGGAIPSMLAYVVSVVGIFRLVRTGLAFIPNAMREARTAAWLAALAFAANPNLLYLQSTAMTEPLYLAVFIWAITFLSDFAIQLLRGDDVRARKALLKCGAVLLFGMMTRYDGWFTAAAFVLSIFVLLVNASLRSGLEPLHFLFERAWRNALIIFALTLIIFPAAWFAWNRSEYKDPLAFARGPYSARAIEARTRKPGEAHHPGWNAPSVGATYLVKSAKLNVAVTERSQRVWIYAALLGSIFLAGFIRPLWPWLMLWVPVPFYAISMAWGGVPIFLPVWWPFSYYNVRYGTQLLPVFAVFGSLLVFLFLRRFSWRSSKLICLMAAVLFVGLSYGEIWRDVPICLREARVNSADRIALESQLAARLAQLPPDSILMMHLGNHGGALQQIGFPLKRTINECHKRRWHSALMAPARMADFVAAAEGDEISEAVKLHPEGLEKIAEFRVPRQGPITLYQSTLHR